MPRSRVLGRTRRPNAEQRFDSSRWTGAAALIGPLGLVLFGLAVLVDDRDTLLLIADLGLGLLVALALGAHLAFHRRRRRNGPTPGGGT